MAIVRKELKNSSKSKNHNGGKKIGLEKSWRKKLKILRARLSQIVASLKSEGFHRLVFNINPKDREGKKVADFNICCKKEEIIRFKLDRKSLTVLTVWMIGGSPKIQSFDEFLEELSSLKRSLKILLK